MQGTPNWNDLRYILAISHRKQLTEAAKLLRVDSTTVSRRLGRLQLAMGQRLYQRLADGRLELTEAGMTAVAMAERIEKDIEALKGGQGGTHGITGTIRLTAVPFIINRILAPAANSLLRRHPHLRLELVSGARDLSLTRREADMALRLARPQIGGMQVKARRVGTLRYESYVAVAHNGIAPSSLPWITYDETMAHLPQARWIDTAAKNNDGRIAQLKVNDIEAAIESVAAGYGRSIFPCLVADRDTRLGRTKPSSAPRNATRELWLLVHTVLCDLPRADAVTSWINATIGGLHGYGRADPGSVTA